MKTTGIVKDFQMLEGNLLKHPICFTYPARVAMSAWMGHVPFGMHIVDVLRPRVIGELGTHYGVSYCAFCQAVKELALDTRCYAIDTWKGDAQAGFYGPEVLADLEEHHNPRYGGFSRLIQSTFDEALDYFADHTFDLLHIDGFHTYDAVKRDFERWLPKMTDRGIILIHDVNVREREFGVWKFWDEVKVRYPSFEFVHTHGLGVLGVGQNYPDELDTLFNCSEAEALRIRHFFSQLGARLEAAQELQILRPAARELPAVRQQNQQLQEQLQALTLQVHSAPQQIATLTQQWQEREKEVHEKVAELGVASQQIEELHLKVGARDRRIEELHHQQLELTGRLQASESTVQAMRAQGEEKALQIASFSEQLASLAQQVLERTNEVAALTQQVQLVPEKDAQLVEVNQQLEQLHLRVGRRNLTIEQHLQQLQELTGRLQVSEEEVRVARAQGEEKTLQIANLSEQLADLAQQLAQSNAAVTALTKQLREQELQSSENEERLIDKNQELDELMRRSSERDALLAEQKLQLLSHKQQFIELTNQLEDLRREAREKMLQLQESNRQVENKQQQLRDQTRDLGTLRSQLEKLTRELAHRTRELEDKDRQLGSTSEQLRQSENREQEKQQELMRLLEAYYATTEQFSRSGSYRLGRALTSPVRFAKRFLGGSDENPLGNVAAQTASPPFEGPALAGPPIPEASQELSPQRSSPSGLRSEGPGAETNAASGSGSRASAAIFDAEWYLLQNPDVAQAGVDPVEHYVNEGAKEGRAPHPLFDPKFYLRTYPDAAISGLSPLDHYLTTGWKEGYKPNPRFDPSFYLSTYSDIADSGVEPLTHFVSDGLREGRAGCKEDVYLEPFEAGFEIPRNPLVDSAPLDSAIKAIAFFLPQFHPIPENDRWWGDGFTEWTNVRRGEPQFREHYQPHVPSTFGYYDLREAEVLEQQVRLAREFGIYGFCFYYYWFAGKVLLDLPVRRMLDSGKPDFPFCICWANENWTRRWDGRDSEILIAQHHSPEDDLAFLRNVENVLLHRNYIRVEGKPLLIVYQPSLLPDARATATRWRDYFRAQGHGELFLAATQTFSDTSLASERGFDALVQFPPHTEASPVTCLIEGLNQSFEGLVYDYNQTKKCALDEFRALSRYQQIYPGVMPSWDNTARRRHKSSVWFNASPESYYDWLCQLIRILRSKPYQEEQFVFINAWNEWAEGCHLEPDQRYGYAWLNATRLALETHNGAHREFDVEQD